METKCAGKVFQAMHAVMAEIGGIAKTNENSFQRYRFRSVAQAMSALQPLLVKHHLILQPHYDSVELHPQEKGYTATCMLSLTFWHVEDGSCLTYRVPGQGSDVSDKGLAKALAMAFKYAVFQGLSVPEDGADAEFSDPEVKPAQPARTKQLKDILG